MSKTKTDLTEKEVVQLEDTNAASANGQKNPEDRELFLIPNLESICEKIGYQIDFTLLKLLANEVEIILLYLAEKLTYSDLNAIWRYD